MHGITGVCHKIGRLHRLKWLVAINSLTHSSLNPVEATFEPDQLLKVGAMSFQFQCDSRWPC